MADQDPIACSLDPSDLRRRLAEITAIGAESLIARDTEGERHLLRFRKSADARRRLEAIIEAEADCCSFLDLSLREQEDALVLSIAAPAGPEAMAIADHLAGAF